MRPLSRLRVRTRSAVLVLAVLVATAGLTGLVSGPAAAATEVYQFPASGTVTVHGNGNGHGHGLSQYGARGAAIAGLSAAEIVNFYYPGTTLTVEPASTTMRVWIAGAGGNTCIAATAGLSVTGVIGTLPTAGINRYRLVPFGPSGLKLQKGTGSGCTGSGWSVVATFPTPQVDFSTSAGFVRTYRSDGTSTDYRGSIGAVRSGDGEITVNRLGLDAYAMGVVPREMPASWQPAATQAQAIAARTYGMFERAQNAGRLYDICDYDQCQVYGGMTHYDAAGNVLWRDEPSVVTGNSNKVLTYKGAAAFTQFSASNGGWTVDGGQPYLVAKADPYDNATSGDPYLNWSAQVSQSQVAGYFGLSRVTAIEITSRDGHGQWGGRVLAGYIDGVDAGGATRHIAATGFAMQSAMGLKTNWFGFDDSAPSAPTNVVATGLDGGVSVTWGAPSSGSASVTGYSVTVGARTVAVDASARTVTLIGFINGRAAVVSVRANSVVGSGLASTASATPNAIPQSVTALVGKRLFDTRSPNVSVNQIHPYRFSFAGAGDIPASVGAATAVQFSLTIANPSADGVLRVQTQGAPVGTTSAVAYRKGRVVTATLSVPITPTSTVEFVPSAGSVALVVDQMGYSGPGLSTMSSVPAVRIGVLTSLPTGNGAVFVVRGAAGVPEDASAVVLSIAGGPATGSGWVRAWPDRLLPPAVSQVTVTPDGSGANTVIVPIGSNGAIRVSGSSTTLGAQISVVGYLAPKASGRGLLETFQSTGMADTGSVGTSLIVGTGVSSLVVLGQPQMPHWNVPAVLLQLTVSQASTYGTLYAYGAGAARPAAPAATYPGGAAGASTTTVLVPVGAGGAISLATSRGTATVSVDVIGWINAG